MIRIPAFLHDLFGESQTVGELLTILLFGLGLATALFVGYPAMTQDVASWRTILAYLLVVDIFAGCVANFTRSTNNYYAARDKQRWLFIAIHGHLLLVGWLLGAGLGSFVMVWGYTVAAASVVNVLKGSPWQKFVAGVLLALGIAIIIVGTSMPPYFLVISLLFMVKVMFSFAVDHYGQVEAG